MFIMQQPSGMATGFICGYQGRSKSLRKRLPTSAGADDRAVLDVVLGQRVLVVELSAAVVQVGLANRNSVHLCETC